MKYTCKAGKCNWTIGSVILQPVFVVISIFRVLGSVFRYVAWFCCVCVCVANAYTYSTFNPNEHAVTHNVFMLRMLKTQHRKKRGPKPTQTATIWKRWKKTDSTRVMRSKWRKKNIRLKAPKQQQQHEDIHCTRSSVQVLDKNAVNLSIWFWWSPDTVQYFVLL